MSETTADTKILQELLATPEVFPMPDDIEALALPPGWTAQRFAPDEDQRPTPRRTARVIEAHEVGGLISYVKRFKDASTALYCKADKTPQVLAILDDHQPGQPMHAKHRALFGCPHTEEWTRWTAMDRKPKAQQEFAEFIEDNLRDIVEPTGAEFLTHVTNLVDTRSTEFKSATRLSDGMVQFQFVETDGGQSVKFPTRIAIAVPVFMGLPTRYRMDLRIKYRAGKDGLAMWYEIDRPDLTKTAAYAELLKLVEEQTGLQVHRAI